MTIKHKFQVGDLIKITPDDGWWKETLFAVLELKESNLMEICIIYDDTEKQKYSFYYFYNEHEINYELVVR